MHTTSSRSPQCDRLVLFFTSTTQFAHAMTLRTALPCQVVLMRSRLLVLLSLVCSVSSVLAVSPTGPLEIAEGDKIVLIGNTLAERMQLDGAFETLLQSRFAGKNLVVRNLGWSADEIDLRPRSANFDGHGHQLRDHNPNIVFAMFGLNESFAGVDGLEDFRKRFAAFLIATLGDATLGDATLGHSKSEPQLVVFSPIPHENLHRRTLPDGSSTNANIELYSHVMQEECEKSSIRFVDLYKPLKKAMEQDGPQFTINGIHLNRYGNDVLASVMDQALFGTTDAPHLDTLAPLREAVIEKDRQFYYDYRAVNGYYIYGGRMNPYGVVNFPEEFAKLRKMIAVRDERIWKIARGETVSRTIDDSETGNLSPIKSNVVEQPIYHTPEESKELFELHEGFEIDLVASEVEFPDLMNPVAIDVDARGRLWVTTTPSYPQYLPGTPVNDKILIFEDTTGDGRADKQTVFADGLHLPIGIALSDGGAYVSQQPNLVFMKDTDGDDRADEQNIILHGFDSADSHHSISAFVVGPGGELYMQEGTFHHTQIETPYGPERVKDAAVFRYEPHTERLSIYASYSFANPWGHCFDTWGQDFVADASPGANYFAAAFSGDVDYPHKHRQLQQFLKKQWRPTAGCLIVGSSQFPERNQGNYIINNTIGFLGTLQYKVSDDGSGFKADPVDPLVSSRDANFRPIGMKFGPDGALYIVDWFNPLIGHMQHNLRDPKRDKHHGRIWRVRNKNKPLLEIPKIEGASIEALLALLDRFDDTVRELARRELRVRPAEEIEAGVDTLLANTHGNDEAAEHRRLEALWVLQSHDLVRTDVLSLVLESHDARARAAATRVLCYWRERINGSTPMLAKMALDENPRVRLEAVRAASFYRDADQGREIVGNALSHPLDEYLNYVITETMTTLDRRGGTKQGGDSAMIEKLARGDVADGQLIQITQLAVRDAGKPQLAQITDSLLSGPFRSDTVASALNEVLATAKTNRIQAAINVQLALSRYAIAQEQRDEALLVSIANMANQWGIEELTQSMRAAVHDSKTPGKAMDAALDAIATFKSPSGNDFRGEIVRTNLPSSTKLRFARAMASVSTQQAVQALGQALAIGVTANDSELLVIAADAVLATKNGLQDLTLVLESNPPNSDAAKLLLRAVYASDVTSGPVVELLSRAAGIGGSAKKLGDDERLALIEKIDKTGDPHAGQWVYRRKELNCVQCHVLSRAGGIVGPDLSGVGVTSPTEYLLDSLLEPSKQIKEAYLTLNVVTSGGEIVRGVKVDRDDKRLILRDENGRETILAVDDIEAEAEGKSLMPEGMQHLVTEKELIDLVAFLGSLGKLGDFVVNTRPTIQRYHYLADSQEAERLARLPEGQLEGELAEIDESKWSIAYALVNGELPVVAISLRPSILILRGEVDVVVAGPIGARATSETDVQLVIDGKSIASNGVQTVEKAQGQHRLYFVIESPEKFQSLSVEITKPAGASTQFTVVGTSR